jgi:hypothetical protein
MKLFTMLSIIACGGDRPYISVWSVMDDGSATRGRAAVHTFTGLDSRPLSLHFNPSLTSSSSSSSSSITYHLAATCDNNNVYVWQWTPSSLSSTTSTSESKTLAPSATTTANSRLTCVSSSITSSVSTGVTRVATEKRGRHSGPTASSSLGVTDGAVLRARFVSRTYPSIFVNII